MNATSSLAGTSALTAGNNPLSDAADHAHQVVDKAAEKAVPTLERAQAAAHRTIDKVADKAAPVAEWAAENSRSVVNRSTELAGAWGNHVRERPLASIAGALAVGYLLGRLMR
jgi:ElaB/YqjD/DUF883 family membrane-anchored ribosome-binding protein